MQNIAGGGPCERAQASSFVWLSAHVRPIYVRCAASWWGRSAVTSEPISARADDARSRMAGLGWSVGVARLPPRPLPAGNVDLGGGVGVWLRLGTLAARVFC